MIFKETQRFNQVWLWLILVVTGLTVNGSFGYGIWLQIFKGQKFGNNPMSDNGLILTFVLVLILYTCLFLLFALLKLTTTIDKAGIEYRFSPFHKSSRFIYWNMIEKCEVLTYYPVKDYGGWGIKSNKQGKAYSVSGDKGLLIYLKSGKRILIGTQKEPELKNFLEKIRQL
jgi:hypothetical protein